MSKRKAGVNDIIYELDNDDVEISSEDEIKDAKKNRLDPETATEEVEMADNDEKSNNGFNAGEIIEEEEQQQASHNKQQNGGKFSPDSIPSQNTISNDCNSVPEADEVDSNKKISGSKTVIFNEDIVVDSPTSTSDLGVVGCENRTPLITVRFRDKKLAASYKTKLKLFMLNLIKLHEDENSDIGSETDLELDIWPEDLEVDETEDYSENNEDNIKDFDKYDNKDVSKIDSDDDNLFFVDLAPSASMYADIPTYQQVSTVISNAPIKEPSPTRTTRRGPMCFNCDGPHPLRECSLPKNMFKITENRKKIPTRVGRYHVEDEQKFGHLIPGRISGQLRHALALKRDELPLYIYRMRVLGYPPGWLEEARISHSGITMFDSSGFAIQDPEEEDGELSEPWTKDQFDIKKILDFPGFNVPASSRYVDESHLYDLPPMTEIDSKITMLETLAPNAMKAYKRKKLTLFPSAQGQDDSLKEVAEMELDSGDEAAEFPSVPPLPDEAPPPAPPPPPPLPESPPPPPPASADDSADDLEVIDVMKVKDIPVPGPETTTDEKPPRDAAIKSPSLDDLEEKKRLLLNALESDVTVEDISIIDLNTTEEITDNKTADESIEILNDIAQDKEMLENSKLNEDNTITENEKSEDNKTLLESKTGHVKTTLYGTPVMNIASSFVKLPTDDKFSKDICDVINFENLPNSTGKYKQISNLLKKVKNEVDRIQES